jgi:DNA-binding beta-propeller fold protein YncE
MAITTVKTAVAIVALGLGFATIAARLSAANGLLTGELLPTGMRITPTATPGSVFQRLNPRLPGLPNYFAGQAVSTAVSPDGNTLLILTSGYNRMYNPAGTLVPEWSTEYVFVFDISGPQPVQRQVLQIPITFNGIAWNPNGNEFYVAGGRDNNVHVFQRVGTTWMEAASSIDLGAHPNQSGRYQPMAAGLAVNPTGDRLVVANMLYDSVTVVNLTSRTVIGDVDLRPEPGPGGAPNPGGSYPFWVVIKGDDQAYVTSQRDEEVVLVDLKPVPQVSRRIPVECLPT